MFRERTRPGDGPTVGFAGSFKCGKSTLLNALLGQELLPSGILPCTAVPVWVTWGNVPSAEIRFTQEDGRPPLRLSAGELPELAQYAVFSDNSAKRPDGVLEIVLQTPVPICRGVSLVDLPGWNNTQEMDQAVEAVLPALDAAVIVTTPAIPNLEDGDIKLLLRLGSGRVLLAVNRLDTVPAPLRPQFADSVRKGLFRNTMHSIRAPLAQAEEDLQDIEKILRLIDKTDGSVQIPAVAHRFEAELRLIFGNRDRCCVERRVRELAEREGVSVPVIFDGSIRQRLEGPLRETGQRIGSRLRQLREDLPGREAMLREVTDNIPICCISARNWLEGDETLRRESGLPSLETALKDMIATYRENGPGV